MVAPLTPPEHLPDGRLETRMQELKPPLDAAGALLEANRCLYCHDAPCIEACPTGINIPEFIRKIATGNLRGAARTIFEENILGHSCARVCPVEVLCQGACVYNNEGHPPIQIGRLQRYATDHVISRGIQLFRRGSPSGWKVGIIGAGPAGLACAHRLTRLGHQVTLFEARRVPGGLNTTGVAPYKMHAETSLEEYRYIAEIGFEIRCGLRVGEHVTREDLEREFAALFIGVGLGPDGFLSIPGDRLEGVVGAVALIERIKLDPTLDLSDVRRALVIGGGNTAIDVARQLAKLEVPEVTLLYRRDDKTMSAYPHEWAQAKAEGVRAIWHALPEQILGTEGHVDRVRCVRVALSDDGRRFEPVMDSQFYVPADLVVMAIGQERISSLFHDLGIAFEKGKVKVDPVTHQTSNPRYFAGGDCVNGGKEVVNAAEEGKKAALGIDAFLRTLKSTGRPVNLTQKDENNGRSAH